MCIKVQQDVALQQQNRLRVDMPVPAADINWSTTIEWVRGSVAATAAMFAPGCGQAIVLGGHLSIPACDLVQAIEPVAKAGRMDGGIRLQVSWGARACAEVLALKRRFGLRSLAVMSWAVESGEQVWLTLVNAACHDVQRADDGSLRVIAESLRERCMLQQRLRESTLVTQRLEDVARASGDWVWETDEQCRYTWVHGELPAMPHHAFWPPKIGELIPSGLVVNWLGEPELPLKDFHAVLRQCEAIVRLVTKEQAQGHTRYVSRSAVPLFNADGTLRGYRGSARDVTQSLEAKAQLWRRERALRRAKERAEASSQAKSVLVSKVGHELRTPLNAIVGLAQLIQMRNAPGDSAAVEQWVAQIAKTGWHMVDVLDMLMELGRTGTVNASIASKPVDLVAVVHDAMHIVEREAQARSIGVEFDCRSPVLALGDRRAICQVVVNLLSNAIKYNCEGGEVRVTVARGERARIEIQDTGPGLSEAQVARMYRPFERLGAERSNVSGHGLGLLICKELVASMNGELQVQSTVGQGTTFTVVLHMANDGEVCAETDRALVAMAQGHE